MLFNSAIFLFAFLPACLGGFLLLRRYAPGLLVAWLLACSFVFYGWWSTKFLALLVLSAVVNWGTAMLLARAGPTRTPVLVLGLAWNLGLLGWFKYANFLIDIANDAGGFGIAALDVVLPLGISFFTFQKIAYLVDVHDGRARPGTLPEFMLFVFFFPQLIAGPIVHHAEMMPQFNALARTGPDAGQRTWSDIGIGATVLLAGLFSKVVIADHLAPFATPVFDRARDGGGIGLLDAWQAALAYTGQLYFDFAGYSTMALGLALLFGIRLPVNFNSPYQATSIIDFWRRWHITLSRFLRDYLYIPLGGNRKGPGRRYLNLMIVMVLGGFWHGAGWTFVAWGALHGAYLLVAHLWRDWGAPRLPAWLGWLLTLLAVVVAWVFFRAASIPAALAVLGAMVGQGEGLATPLFSRTGTWLSVAIIGFAALAPNIQTLMRGQAIALNIEPPSRRLPAWIAWRPSYPWAAAAGLAVTALVLSSSNRSEFLYFQF